MKVRILKIFTLMMFLVEPCVLHGAVTEKCGVKCDLSNKGKIFYCEGDSFKCDESRGEFINYNTRLFGCEYGDPEHMVEKEGLSDWKKHTLISKLNLENKELRGPYKLRDGNEVSEEYFCVACSGGAYSTGGTFVECFTDKERAWCSWRKMKNSRNVVWEGQTCKCKASGMEWDTEKHDCVDKGDSTQSKEVKSSTKGGTKAVSKGTRYTGVVKDQDGFALGGVHVVLRAVDPTHSPCTTDASGKFNCELPDNRVTVQYQGFTDDVDLNKNVNNEITLNVTKNLDSVTVVEQNGAATIQPKTAVPLPVDQKLDNLSDVKEPGLDEKLCESENNGGKWNKEKNTCDCPEKKLWIKSMQKCEDAELSDLQDACWKLMKSGQTLWDEETNSCTCIKEDKTADENKQYEYDSKRKTGKCVKVKKEKQPEPKAKPKERTDEEKAAALAERKKDYTDARDNEQSDANKLLTAGTTLATGLGGMELARGWAEQSADKKADESMDAYIVTMRCTYGDGKPVTLGNELIELPGGNDETMKKYRNEYISLAADLKERKESLSMKLGIESEVVLDKAKMGLYDDENVGITGGSYASLYRAKMMDSETDKAKIASDQEASSNRMKYGGLALGVGAAVGILGNSLINGRLGEKIKEIKENINYRRNEESALKDLKQCLKDAGATNVNKLKFDKFTPSVLNLDGIDCKKDLVNIKGKDATTLFADSDDGETITNKLVKSFGKENTSAMLGDVVVPGQSFEIKAEQIVETPKGNKAIITRFESDTDYGDGVGYCYNFIDGFVRGEIQSKDCDALKAGDWIAQFSGGTIEGISVCSTVRPDGMEHGAVPSASQQKQIQQSYDDWVKAGRPQPSSSAKTACYCKKNGQDTDWVFDSYFTGFSCRSGCAYFCAYLTKEQTSFRKAVAGK